MTEQVADQNANPGGAPPTGGEQPVAPAAATRPEWLPEDHWDGTANLIKPEFGQHYADLSTFHKTETERQATLAARKPEDIKIEVKLPETVKVPEGFEIKINESDPRVPVIRDLAIKHGLNQDAIDSLVALDAQMQIDAHGAEMQRIAAEDAKLGANAKARKDAVGNWLKGLKDNKVIEAHEYEAARVYATDAATVTFLEKIIAKANGSVPSSGNEVDTQKPAEVPVAQRWYGATTPQKKVS